jgi:hypothetical protein
MPPKPPSNNGAVVPKHIPESAPGVGKGAGKGQPAAVPIVAARRAGVIPRSTDNPASSKSGTPIPVRAPVETLEFRGPPRVRTHYQSRQLQLVTKYPANFLCLPSAKPIECIGIAPKGKWVVPTPKQLLRPKAEVRRPRDHSSNNPERSGDSANGPNP